MKVSILVAALPKPPLPAYMRFRNFFSANPLTNAARSRGRSIARIPTAAKSLTTDSGPVKAASQKNSPASNPFGKAAATSDQQLSVLGGIVRGRGRLPEELEIARNDAPGEPH